jgi:hypothetical protein
MKIDLKEEEYRSLVDLLSLAGCMLEGYGRGNDSKKSACFELEQKLMSLAEDAGCQDLIERDVETGTYLRKWSRHRKENAVEWLYQYNDDVFWEELIVRMAERDLQSLRAVEEGAGDAPRQKEKPSRLVELEKHYEKEFVANGLDNLVLRNQAAEGIN